jgi:drug/metabolite transporter (DMT)-like permease
MNVFLGIALQLAATLTFTIMGALIRFVGDRVPLGEVIFMRSFIALAPLLIMLAWRRELSSAVQMRSPWAHLSRAVTGVAAMYAMFAGLARLPLADATAITFATPLMNVALAALFLGEVVRIWRWSAVFIGFIGVLVMVSPHLGATPRDEAASYGAIYMLAGAFLTAAAMTQVRRLTATESTASIVFTFSAISSIAGLATLPSGWIMPAAVDVIALIGIGFAGGIGQILITDSYRHAPAAVVAPFSYTTMLWAVIIGYLAFGEVPEPIVLMGAAIVVAAGLFVIWRERRLGLDRTREREAETPPGGPAV